MFLKRYDHCLKDEQRFNALTLCVRVSGVRAVGGSKHRAEVSDRGTEAGTSASHPHAQPPPSHLHRPQRQRPDPGEREEPAAGADLAVVRRSRDVQKDKEEISPSNLITSID